jgi:glycosyltransferase involved in cell wall biosynthesis
LLLSILIPVYNERTVVDRSLSQVLGAPLPENMDRELVIVDDCSTDGTSAILERLAAAYPSIRLISCEPTLSRLSPHTAGCAGPGVQGWA